VQCHGLMENRLSNDARGGGGRVISFENHEQTAAQIHEKKLDVR
jgi:hypothetical protein